MTDIPEEKIIAWKPFFDALTATGIIDEPSRTTRIVIDCEVGQPAKLTIYKFGDNRLIVAGNAIAYADTPEDAIVT